MQGGGATDGSDCELRTGERDDMLFELDDLGAHGGYEVGIDAVDQVFFLVAFENGTVERDNALAEHVFCKLIQATQ